MNYLVASDLSSAALEQLSGAFKVQAEEGKREASGSGLRLEILNRDTMGEQRPLERDSVSNWSELNMTILALILLTTALIFNASAATAEDSSRTAIKPEITEQYVMLYYEDLAEPAAFYGDLLGLTAVMDNEWVKLYEVLPNSFIGVVKGGEEGSVWHEPQPHNAVMVSIVSENVDAWYDVIKNSGRVKVLKDIYDNPSVPIRAFLVADPGGYTIEFFQWLDR